MSNRPVRRLSLNMLLYIKLSKKEREIGERGARGEKGRGTGEGKERSRRGEGEGIEWRAGGE